MTDTTYHLAARIAAAKILPRQIAAQTRALVVRLQALHRLSAGLGIVAWPRGDRRMATDQHAAAGAGYRAALLPRMTAPAMVRRPFLRSDVSDVAGAKRASFAMLAGPRRTSYAGFAPPLAGAVVRPGVGPAGKQTGLALQMRRGLAAPSKALAEVAPRIAPIGAVSAGSRVRRRLAAAAPQPAAAPGFHRTVRQPQTTAAAGNVYLDKTLVGYHLAAAITAEQTRAAARPNGAGASFNSSMAALRPTGAGL